MPSFLRSLSSSKTLKSLFSTSSVAADDIIPKFHAAISAARRHHHPSSSAVRRRTKTLDDLLSLISKRRPSSKPSLPFLNTLLNSLLLAGRPSAALSLLRRALSSGIPLSNPSYSILLKLLFLSHPDPVPPALALLLSMLRSGPRPDAATYSTLISALCRSGRLHEAWGVLDLMLEHRCPPTVRCYTSLVLAYCNQGRIAEASDLVERMRALGCPPDAVTYTILVAGLSKDGRFRDVERVLAESESKGWAPNEVTYNVYMNELCRAGLVDETFRQVDAMRLRGLCPTMETLNILFDCLCRNSKLWEAKCLLERSDELDWDVDAVFYNTLMSRLCRLGAWMTVLKLLTDMVKKGFEPDACTFTIVICSLCKARKLRKAKCIADSKGIGADVVAYNTLLHGFYNEGEFDEARLLFWNMRVENVVPNKFTYSIVIDSFCQEEKFSEAISFLWSVENLFLQYLVARLIRWLVSRKKLKELLTLFDEMLARHLALDGFIFHTLISAFCRKGFCQSGETDKLALILDIMLGIRGEFDLIMCIPTDNAGRISISLFPHAIGYVARIQIIYGYRTRASSNRYSGGYRYCMSMGTSVDTIRIWTSFAVSVQHSLQEKEKLTFHQVAVSQGSLQSR